MSAKNRNDIPVWITGIGLLTSLGEGPQAHLDLLNGGTKPNVDETTFAPYPVHPLGDVDWSTQMSRRDMRQMERWQQIGTYAAGLALDDAGIKGNEDLVAEMDMIVAAGGGERDQDVDASIMSEGTGLNDRDALLAERLSNDLRPTLFLAQLSNLLAGNISIVHKVTGSSRTFMGEEGAGISAIKTAAARIAAGQSQLMLVGGASNGERTDMMLSHELNHYLLRGAYKPVSERQSGDGGFVCGSMGIFLVLESPEHAKARGVKPYAVIEAVEADHGSREPGAAKARFDRLATENGSPQSDLVISGATGVKEASAEELGFIGETQSGKPVRVLSDLFGHGVEAQFPLGIALAALALKNGTGFAPFSTGESGAEGAPERVAVTCAGPWRSEGLAYLIKAS